MNSTESLEARSQTPEVVAELRRIEAGCRAPKRFTLCIIPKNFHYGNTKGIKKVVLLETFDYKCFYCSRQLDFGTATKDHLVPEIQGGGNEILNLVLSCTRCNKRKGNSLPTQEQCEKALEAHCRYRISQLALDRKLHHVTNPNL